MQKPILNRIALITFLALTFLSAARAQLVSDGTTAAINGTSTNITGTLTIGSSGSFTTLIITNAGTVTNSGVASIGASASAKTNRVVVTDTNSIWSNGSNLAVGTAGGSYSSLLVTNGGRVISTFANVGHNGSSNNLAVVTGTNSIWTSGSMVIGNSGYSNQLVIRDGGKIESTTGTIGASTSSSNNIAVITDAGSRWIISASSELLVGDGGAFNTLLVTNGGEVSSFSSTFSDNTGNSNNLVIVTGTNSVWTNTSYIRLHVADRLVITNAGKVFDSDGSIGTAASSSNNVVTVTGANSLWTNRQNVYVGESGSSNQLIVSDSGTVKAPVMYLGLNASSSNNTATVNGGNIIITNSSATGSTHVRQGALILESGLMLSDRLLLTNGTQSVLAFNGGTLQTRTTTNDNGSPFIVGNGTSSAMFELLGSGTHRFVNGLQIASNALLKGNGTIAGNVTNAGNLSPGASIGQLIVNGSLFLASGSTNVFEVNKSSGTNDNIIGLTDVIYGGTLQVANISGTLTSGDNFKLLTASSYSGAFASLELPALGSGLIWTNKLLVDGSIEVVAPSGDRFWANTLGGNYDVASNWLDGQVPTVADNANFTNNAAYEVNWPTSAQAANAYFNAGGFVTQAIGSASWTLTNSYIVGQDVSAFPTTIQTSGSLIVTNAVGTAFVEARRGTLQLDAGTITTDRLMATNSIGEFIFNGGTLVTRGGLVSNTQPFIVGASGSTPATLIVRSNQPFVVNHDFYLSPPLFAITETHDNSLYITNGGVLQTINGSLGDRTASSNNFALISGPNSLWTNQLTVLVGGFGSFNQLVVSNGGTLKSAGGQIGSGIGSSNNTVIVTGTNSLWNNGELAFGELGFYGSSGELVISNGGRMAESSCKIGFSSGSSNNVVTVSGSNSVWANSGTIYIGFSGSSNRLSIANGGVVHSSSGYIGNNAGSSNNLVVVSGAGSVWSNAYVTVGEFASGNQLVVSNSGTVIAVSNLFLGNSTMGTSGNKLTLSGGTVIVTNASAAGLMQFRRGTFLLESGLLVTDALRLTNGASTLTFNGGTIQTRSTTNSGTSVPFVVGNSSSSATLELLGNGIHRFNQGLRISSKATLKGNGTIVGSVTNNSGGTLSVGASIGKMIITGNLALANNSTNVFEVNKSSGTNDNIIGLTNVMLGGTLVLTNLDGTLTNGTTFQLFSAGSYGGSFSSLVAPSPGAGLAWNYHRISFDGILGVILAQTNALAVSSPTFSNGTNVIITASGGIPFNPVYLLTSTNLNTTWTLVSAHTFDANGNVTVTNTVLPNEFERYFNLQLE